MFINFKALIISCFAVVALLGFCAWQDIKIKNIKTELRASELKNLAIQANLNECIARVDLQNQKVRQLMLDNEALASRQTKIKEKIITKFKHIKIPVRDDVCEVKLKFYENLFKTLQKQEEKDD